jgi:hypothetical protein
MSDNTSLTLRVDLPGAPPHEIGDEIWQIDLVTRSPRRPTRSHTPPAANCSANRPLPAETGCATASLPR